VLRISYLKVVWTLKQLFWLLFCFLQASTTSKINVHLSKVRQQMKALVKQLIPPLLLKVFKQSITSPPPP